MNAIVTGARKGIGRAIVEKFIKNGINVWACTSHIDDAFMQNLKELSENEGYVVTDSVTQNDSWIMPIELDLRNEESIKDAVKKIYSAKDSEGKRLSVDILVNNAGVSSSGMMQMTSMDTLRDVMEVNFIGQMSLI